MDYVRQFLLDQTMTGEEFFCLIWQIRHTNLVLTEVWQYFVSANRFPLGLFQEKRCWGGVERNLKMGVPPTKFYLFYGTESIWIFLETPPTHIILIDFSSTPPRCPFSWNSPYVKTFADWGIRNIAFRKDKCSVKQTVMIDFFLCLTNYFLSSWAILSYSLFQAVPLHSIQTIGEIYLSPIVTLQQKSASCMLCGCHTRQFSIPGVLWISIPIEQTDQRALHFPTFWSRALLFPTFWKTALLFLLFWGVMMSN